jgi:serine/threonine protein kinase
MNAPEPSRFGKYEILEKLGSGAMGVVYLAHDPVIDRRVAVKTIHKHTLDAVPDAAKRFRREASAAGRLNHPGIVAVYDYGEDKDVAFIVMEYAAGLPLDRYAAQHRPNTQQVAGLMVELLGALGYAHTAGVVHRDVKPGNILVAERLKITDFGIARIDNVIQTKTGMAIGTPAYMAPEQFSGKDVDHRVDLFAVGVVLYQLLTGHRPFEAQALEELSYKICHADPLPATSLAPNLPPAIDAVLMRALAKSKTDRFASATELSRAISDALAVPAAAQQSPPEPPQKPIPITPEAIERVTRALADSLGPIAKLLTRKAAHHSGSYLALCLHLSEQLSTEEEKARFLREVGVP